MDFETNVLQADIG